MLLVNECLRPSLICIFPFLRTNFTVSLTVASPSLALFILLMVLRLLSRPELKFKFKHIRWPARDLLLKVHGCFVKRILEIVLGTKFLLMLRCCWQFVISHAYIP